MPGLSKKSSQTGFEGTITRRLPSRTSLTSSTLSGNVRLLPTHSLRAVRPKEFGASHDNGSRPIVWRLFAMCPWNIARRAKIRREIAELPTHHYVIKRAPARMLDAGRAAVYSLGYSDPRSSNPHQPYLGRTS
jgi:hypothetical protein